MKPKIITENTVLGIHTATKYKTSKLYIILYAGL